MTDASSFTKLVPGFDFLQGLVKNAGAALPGIGQWVAPTIDPAELEKRIQELRTVQYWLEQNARMLGATIQALEVQRMTLSTLKTMNVQMEGLRDTLKVRMPEPEPVAEEPAVEPAPAAPVAPGAVDPMQWWGALTKQFTELATSAMKEGDAARAMAGAMVKTPFDTTSPPPTKTAARKKPAARKKAAARTR
ncbi:MAG: PhaM family polyhydroxyalkanoate granule multifunctional regulatory protein [Burkholderiales bacterium]